MIGTRGWAVLAAGVLLVGLGGTAAAQGRPGCGGGGGRGMPPQMSNQMGGGMGMSQMSRGGYPGQGGAPMAQQQAMQRQLLALQLQQMQADSMGDDLMASLVAADLRRYQDRLRQIQKAQQQQLNGGR